MLDAFLLCILQFLNFEIPEYIEKPLG